MSMLQRKYIRFWKVILIGKGVVCEFLLYEFFACFVQAEEYAIDFKAFY